MVVTAMTSRGSLRNNHCCCLSPILLPLAEGTPLPATRLPYPFPAGSFISSRCQHHFFLAQMVGAIVDAGRPA